MHVSVYEKLQNSKHFNLVQNSSRYLDVTKVMTGYIPEPQLKIQVKIPVGAQGFVGSPTPSWLHNDLFIPPDVPGS